MTTGARRGVALAVLSGALSYAACLAGDEGTRWGAGIAFGLLVLGPTAGAAAPRFLALAALSTAVYRAAVWIAVRLTVDTPVPAVAACAIAGVGGAVVLSLGAGAIAGAGAGVGRGPTARAALGGAAAGAAIGVAVDAPDESLAQHLFLFAGFVAWQVGYTVAHRLEPWRRGAPA